ncbi:MAG: GxxExxY protein [Pseudomonadota bacterium]
MRRESLEEIAQAAVDAALKVHRTLGPGLLESAYQECLKIELENRSHRVETEVLLPIQYDGHQIEKAFRIDMLIDNNLIIENKISQNQNRIHEAQLFTYLKLSGLKLGLLINWNHRLLKQGIKRVVHGI